MPAGLQGLGHGVAFFVTVAAQQGCHGAQQRAQRQPPAAFVLVAQVLRHGRVVLVVAEHDEGAQARPDRSQQIDHHVDVGDFFAHVAGDAQQVGGEPFERRLLRAEQALVAAADVHVADVHDRELWPGRRERQAVPFEHGSVRLAEDGVDDAGDQHGQRQEEQQCERQHDARIMVKRGVATQS